MSRNLSIESSRNAAEHCFFNAPQRLHLLKQWLTLLAGVADFFVNRQHVRPELIAGSAPVVSGQPVAAFSELAPVLIHLPLDHEPSTTSSAPLADQIVQRLS